ncbi:uncharacterized protein K02A2.6-like [Salarias fasciatus]|uniref:uncharacterized protein K02A2.6-like n=1 Tax=Salarias fasciatus TaxID=181472 RepID=UPI0011768AAB|nr:uncharacterized protein K02A2.6-like [Salarias fasciatus]
MAGKADILVELNGQKATLPLYVVKGDYPALMGRPWLEVMRLDWKAVNVVSTAPTRLSAVLKRHAAVFNDELGNMKGITVKLQVKPDTKQCFMKARTVPYALRPKVDAEIERLVNIGVMEPVPHSEWATPVVPVIKKDGSVRLCGDFKMTVNPALTVEQYPLPVIEDQFAGLAGGKTFSKIDLNQAYLQMSVEAESQELLTITTHRGLYRYRRLPFGITSAPAVFQRAMDQVLSGLSGVQCYLDDILVTGKNEEEHLVNLKNTLRRLEDYGLRVREDKCDFFKPAVEYLGHVIDADGLHTAPSKVTAITDAPAPENVGQLRSFLGLLNYYGKFIPHLATQLQPLHELLKAGNAWSWSKECEVAFNTAKSALTDKTVLTHFDASLPLQLACDASPYGVGAVVSHITPTGEEKPIAFASRTLSKAEKNYPQIEKEALSIIFGIKKFHTYLYGRRFTLLTDHRPLTSIFGPHTGVPTLAASRMQRWALILSAHDYDIRYRQSGAHANADSLSRLPLPEQPRNGEQTIFYFEVVEGAPVTARQVRKETKGDPILSRVLDRVMRGDMSRVTGAPPELQPYFLRGKELTVTAGCLLWGMRVIIPKKLRESVLRELHSGHCSIVRMKELARSYFWWPGLDNDIESKVKSCSSCQVIRNTPSLAPLHPWDWPASPWQRIHLDFAGPIEGVMLLVAVDAHSKWPEVAVMSNITSEKTIQTLREMFCRFGLPEQVVTDNGPSFVSKEMEDFLQSNGIKHILSSPYHPSSNRLAERMVQTVKHAIKASKSESPLKQRLDTFLLKYRNTPHPTTGTSPAYLLMKRRLRTRLDLLRPATPETSVHEKQQKQVDRRAKRSKDRQFSVGDAVLARNYTSKEKWTSATVVQKTGPVSYHVYTQDNQTWRRHVDQLLPGSATPPAVVTADELTPNQGSFSPTVAVPSPPAEPEAPESADPPVFESTPEPVPVPEPRRNPPRDRKPPERFR